MRFSSVFGAYQGCCCFLLGIMDWYLLYCVLWSLKDLDHCVREWQEWASPQGKATAKAGGATVSVEQEQQVWWQYPGQTIIRQACRMRQVWRQARKSSQQGKCGIREARSWAHCHLQHGKGYELQGSSWVKGKRPPTNRASHSYFLHSSFSELSSFHSSWIQGYTAGAIAEVILNRGS